MRVPRRIQSAPVPLGPPNLWPDSESRSAPRASTSTAILPTVWTASVWNTAPASCATSASSAMGWMVPISLLACITDTRAVCAVSAWRSASGLITPSRSGSTSVNVQPRRARCLQRIEDRLVFDRAGDQVPAPARFERLGDAADGEVVRLGAAGRPDQVVGLGADERGHTPPCEIQVGFGLLPKRMHARRVAEVVGKRLGHGLEYRGMKGRRGVVVEIDPHDWLRS